MPRRSVLVITAVFGLLQAAAHGDDKPKTLLSRIAEWQYPSAKMTGATMSDAATVDEKGERTVPSIQCKVVLTSPDPIDKVVEYYKSQLSKKADSPKESERGNEAESKTGRSVTFHSDSDGRPVAIHVILINTDHTSTTLVISRAKAESETHIAWSQYEKFDDRHNDAG